MILRVRAGVTLAVALLAVIVPVPVFVAVTTAHDIAADPLLPGVSNCSVQVNVGVDVYVDVVPPPPVVFDDVNIVRIKESSVVAVKLVVAE